MSDTAQRLEMYKAAEARILGQAQEVRHRDRWRRNAELETIQKTIKELEAKLAAEVAAAGGQIGPRFMVASFNRDLG